MKLRGSIMKYHEVTCFHPVLNKQLPSFPGIPLKDDRLRELERLGTAALPVPRTCGRRWTGAPEGLIQLHLANSAKDVDGK